MIGLSAGEVPRSVMVMLHAACRRVSDGRVQQVACRGLGLGVWRAPFQALVFKPLRHTVHCGPPVGDRSQDFPSLFGAFRASRRPPPLASGLVGGGVTVYYVVLTLHRPHGPIAPCRGCRANAPGPLPVSIRLYCKAWPSRRAGSALRARVDVAHVRVPAPLLLDDARSVVRTVLRAVLGSDVRTRLISMTASAELKPSLTTLAREQDQEYLVIQLENCSPCVHHCTGGAYLVDGPCGTPKGPRPPPFHRMGAIVVVAWVASIARFGFRAEAELSEDAVGMA